MSDNSDNADRAEKSAEENLHGPTFEKAIELFNKTLDKHLDRKLTSHKREFEDNSSHLRKKIKEDTELSFRFKGNKKQFQFNEEILAKVETLEKHIIKGKTDSAIDKVSDIRKELNKRNKLIRMADKSQAGWACVEEYLSDELASDSEDDRKSEQQKTAPFAQSGSTEGVANGVTSRIGLQHRKIISSILLLVIGLLFIQTAFPNSDVNQQKQIFVGIAKHLDTGAETASRGNKVTCSPATSHPSSNLTQRITRPTIIPEASKGSSEANINSLNGEFEQDEYELIDCHRQYLDVQSYNFYDLVDLDQSLYEYEQGAPSVIVKGRLKTYVQF